MSKFKLPDGYEIIDGDQIVDQIKANRNPKGLILGLNSIVFLDFTSQHQKTLSLLDYEEDARERMLGEKIYGLREK